MQNSDPILENLLSQIGTGGRYQVRQCGLNLICAFLAGMHMLSLTFVANTPKHRCFIEEVDSNLTTLNKNLLFDTAFLAPYIPLKDNGELDSCHRIHYERAFDNTSIATCKGKFVYDKSAYINSRVSEFDMVCDGKWKRALIQSIYVFGVLNGALICGILSDRFGRRKILYISGLLQFLFAFLAAYVSHFELYCVTLFFYGFFGSGGAFVTGFVLSIELIDKSRRSTFSAIYASSFATGVCSIAFWSYFIRDATLLQTVFALHAILLFGHNWLVDESVRWLYGQGRTHEAIEIIRKACRENGLPFNNEFKELTSPSHAKSPGNDSRKYGLSDLFKTPVLRFRAVNTAFQWFAIALCFYGLAFNTGALPGDPYLVFFIAGFIDIPGHVFVALVVDWTGRRSLNSLLLSIGGAACIATTIIPKGLLITTVIALIAKSALAGCFSVMYNYTGELFPTVIRNSAIGLCSFSARLGGTLTPQITLLDSLDRRFPTLVFGCVAIFAAILSLFLPETLNKDLPQTIEDGENFRRGDTAFSNCLGTPSPSHLQETEQEQRQRLQPACS